MQNIQLRVLHKTKFLEIQDTRYTRARDKGILISGETITPFRLKRVSIRSNKV